MYRALAYFLPKPKGGKIWVIESVLELIGGTPLLKLNGYTKKQGIT